MEKRIGVISVIAENKSSISTLNNLFSQHSEIILARQGLPLQNHKIHVITLIVEGNTDQIGALTGKIGKLPGLQVKSVLNRYREKDNGSIKEIS